MTFYLDNASKPSKPTSLAISSKPTRSSLNRSNQQNRPPKQFPPDHVKPDRKTPYTPPREIPPPLPPDNSFTRPPQPLPPDYDDDDSSPEYQLPYVPTDTPPSSDSPQDHDPKPPAPFPKDYNEKPPKPLPHKSSQPIYKNMPPKPPPHKSVPPKPPPHKTLPSQPLAHRSRSPDPIPPLPLPHKSLPSDTLPNKPLPPEPLPQGPKCSNLSSSCKIYTDSSHGNKPVPAKPARHKHLPLKHTITVDTSPDTSTQDSPPNPLPPDYTEFKDKSVESLKDLSNTSLESLHADFTPPEPIAQDYTDPSTDTPPEPIPPDYTENFPLPSPPDLSDLPSPPDHVLNADLPPIESAHQCDCETLPENFPTDYTDRLPQSLPPNYTYELSESLPLDYTGTLPLPTDYMGTLPAPLPKTGLTLEHKPSASMQLSKCSPSLDSDFPESPCLDNLPEKPQKPLPSDCCGNGCDPCINDIYEQELKIWELKMSGQTYRKDVPNDKAIILTDSNVYHNFTIQDIIPVTKNINIYTFTFPRSSLLGVGPGQHMLLKEGGITRQYTPISPIYTQGSFQVLIKTYDDGKMSEFVRRWKKGRTTLWRGPLGSFQYVANSYKRVLMLAVGTGLTPMVNVIDKIVSNEDDETFVTLLYGCRCYSEILLRSVLNKYCENWNFQVLYYLSDQTEGYTPR